MNYDRLSYLEMLDPEQRQAVEHTGRSLLILAGPGSGKTTVVTAKIAYLIHELRVDPHTILAVTFTKAAAKEMAERTRAIDGAAVDVMFKTIHAFAYWFLRCYCKGVNSYYDDFTVLDERDSLVILGEVVENIKSQLSHSKSKEQIKHIFHVISRVQADGIVPGYADSKYGWNTDIAKIYPEFKKAKAAQHVLSYDDLITDVVECLQSNADIAESFRKRFKYILVDEYQDTSLAQVKLFRSLWTPEINICVVGDDNQSIYAFRGAVVENILNFKDEFPGTDICFLRSNYRSYIPIVEVANEIMKPAKYHIPKTCISVRGSGPSPVMVFTNNHKDEAEICANIIWHSAVWPGKPEKPGSVYDVIAGKSRSNFNPFEPLASSCLQKNVIKRVLSLDKYEETKPGDWAILYRTHIQAMYLSPALYSFAIPCKVRDSKELRNREELRDFYALLSLLVNPRAVESFRRVVNKPPRGVGPVTLSRIIQLASNVDGNLLAAARMICPSLEKRASRGLSSFIKAMDNAIQTIENGTYSSAAVSNTTLIIPLDDEGVAHDEGVARLFIELFNTLGLTEYYLQKDIEDPKPVIGSSVNPSRIHIVQNIITSLTPFPLGSLDQVLEAFQFMKSDSLEDEDDGKVVLSTLHAAKGLEYKRVIIVGNADEVFPMYRDISRASDLEAERRLFYVGVTRAKDRLYLCSPRNFPGSNGLSMEREPSAFFSDLSMSRFSVVGDPKAFQEMRLKRIERFVHEYPQA